MQQHHEDRKEYEDSFKDGWQLPILLLMFSHFFLLTAFYIKLKLDGKNNTEE